MIQTLATIILNECIVQDYWRMTIRAQQIASRIQPGQFIHIKIAQSNDLLLRRPFTVARVANLNNGNSGLEIVYNVVGRGTRFMTSLQPGDTLDIIGPLGHGFKLCSDKNTHILIAGGIGATCLLMLGEAMDRDGLDFCTMLGVRTKDALILENEFNSFKGKVLIATDDGTYGYKGSVIEMLKDALINLLHPSECAIYACGPEPMYRALASICEAYKIPGQVSIERNMMCGFGSCYTCICKVDKNNVTKYRDIESSYIQLSPDEDFGYALVCKDGPVFNIDEVRFDE